MEMRVVLDRLGSYSPGETLLGKVILVKSGITLLPKPLGLHISIDGKASVKFTQMGDKWRGYKSGGWRTHTASESYFHSAQYLAGDGESEVIELSGGGGVSEYPFTFTLPPQLPSSYKGSHGSVDYTITLILKRSWGVNKELIHPFQVTSQLDISTLHHLQTRVEGGGGGTLGSLRKSERVGMLWWGGTVFVHFNLRKKVYVPGEYLQFNAQIINDSKSSLHKAKLLLTQEVRYMAQGYSHVVTHILKKVKGPGVKGGDRRVNWEDPNALKIPPLPPTTAPPILDGGNNGETSLCSLIEVNYFVHLVVQPYSLTFKDRSVLCKLPIILGTKRGVGCRDSWCYGGGGYGDNRVGSIFDTLDRGSDHNDRVLRSTMASPTSTIGSMSMSHHGGGGTGDWSYYQNVVFPLNRCFSAPLYENHRFRHGHVSPFSLQEEPMEEQEQDNLSSTNRPEPPPTYEEAIMHGGRGDREVVGEYQNNSSVGGGGMITRGGSTSYCTSPQEPLYNNE